ncbi:MAG: lytic transglycosylase domain-containing protein [Alphaproteobacteria bacterium]
MTLKHIWRAAFGRAWLRTVALAGAMLLASAGSLPVAANDLDFASWLRDFKAEARTRGISQRTLDAALNQVTLLPRVIELDRKQPEFTLTFDEYVSRVVSPSRVDRGRELLAQRQALLARVSASYGVAPRFVVALWGIESDYGRTTGDYSVIQSLATLAYDGRRASYFRGELIDALKIVELGYMDLASLRGSWAGAMGQSQFMPSSYLRYAVDYEGKGQRDIWHNPADVFASTANYLAQLGWQAEQGWGEEVKLPDGFDSSLAELATQKPLAEWSAIGVRRLDGTPLPSRPLAASIVLPAADGGPAYLVYDNFRVIMRWNRSTFFAISVGLLADRIAGQ